MHLAAAAVEIEIAYLFGNSANSVEFNHCHSPEKAYLSWLCLCCLFGTLDRAVMESILYA